MVCSCRYRVLDFNSSVQSRRPVIIAHRGASKAKRENTLEAFEAAIEMGADAIEFDVRRTRDGVYVVHHDPAVASSDTLIADSNYIDIDNLARKQGFHIPTLEEALSACQGRIGLNIELKEEGYEGDVVPFIRERVEAASAVITSFNDNSVKQTASAWPEVRTGLILGVDSPASVRTRISELFPENRLRRCGADFVAAHHRLIRFGFLKRMLSAGYPVWVWTVDDPARTRALIRQGASGIITNVPDQLRGICGKTAY
ncbi:MAG: glycerophosphodiester phosphodiesterase [Candidatus Zixiibacteriota bacterium]|nr:MAG: glycerophosphodiester phosphodiesterase [candidate division Zixibacteria bacterium]